jgi:cell division GTPase FtsZ
VDFADVRAIMANAGSSLMGIGTATGNLMLILTRKFRMLIFVLKSCNHELGIILS